MRMEHCIPVGNSIYGNICIHTCRHVHIYLTFPNCWNLQRYPLHWISKPLINTSCRPACPCDAIYSCQSLFSVSHCTCKRSSLHCVVLFLVCHWLWWFWTQVCYAEDRLSHSPVLMDRSPVSVFSSPPPSIASPSLGCFHLYLLSGQSWSHYQCEKIICVHSYSFLASLKGYGLGLGFAYSFILFLFSLLLLYIFKMVWNFDSWHHF